MRKSYRDSERYQHQGSLVRICRQARWLPYLWWRYAYCVYWFVMNEDKYPIAELSRGILANLRDLWDIERGAHDIRIGHHYSLDEVKQRMTRECGAIE